MDDWQIRERYQYDPFTGIISARKAYGNIVKGKEIKGAMKRNKAGKNYRTLYGISMARIAWFLKTGAWPRYNQHIGFRNGDSMDLRWENLYLRQPGNFQKTWRSTKSSQYIGVSWNQRDKRWIAQCAGRYLGSFTDEEEAAHAYDTEALRAYGPGAYLNF